MLSDSETIAPYLHVGGGFGTVKAFVGDNTGEVSKRYNGGMYRAGIGLRLAERFLRRHASAGRERACCSGA